MNHQNLNKTSFSFRFSDTRELKSFSISDLYLPIDGIGIVTSKGSE